MSTTRGARTTVRDVVRTVWSAAITAALFTLLAADSYAALRVPQVPVSGTALASFFASQIQAINVVGSQIDAQQFSVPLGGSFQVNAFGNASANFGAYNTAAATPSFYQIFPGAATPGWFVLASFRSTPDRLIVNLFDALSASQGSSVYLGADHTSFGFYSQSGAGTAYSEDFRNSAGRAQMLAYNGTGSRTGSIWIAIESTPGAGGDFADAMFLVTFASGPVPAAPSNWNRVKSLFR